MGATLYFDVSALRFLHWKREEALNLAKLSRNSASAAASVKMDPCADLLYYQALQRLVETVFCMIKLVMYVYTKFREQENLYFYARIGKFAAVSIVFYEMVSYMMQNYGLAVVGIAFEVLVIVRKAAKYTKAFQERAKLKQTLKRYYGTTSRHGRFQTVKQIPVKDRLCAICFAEMQAGKRLFCGHVFHEDCLRSGLYRASPHREWIKAHSICPTCRRPFDSSGGGNGLDPNEDEATEEEKHVDSARERSKPMGAVTFALPKDAADRVEPAEERRRIRFEAANRRSLAAERKKREEKKE